MAKKAILEYSVWVMSPRVAKSRKHVEDSHGQCDSEALSRDPLTDSLTHSAEDFISLASHDLREPLQKILAFNDILQMKLSDRLDDKEKDYFQRIHSAAHQMNQLIDDLLLHAQTGRLTNDREPVALDDILDRQIKELAPLIKKTKAKIESKKLGTVYGSRIALTRLFKNILLNSLTYHYPKRKLTIEISSEKRDGSYQIIFRDNGMGFEPQYSEAIFKPLHRLHTKDEYPGSGLGLATCRLVADLHNGHISATGEPDQGATFTLELPSIAP